MLHQGTNSTSIKVAIDQKYFPQDSYCNTCHSTHAFRSEGEQHWETTELNQISLTYIEPIQPAVLFVFVFAQSLLWFCKFKVFPQLCKRYAITRLCKQTLHFCSFDKKQNISQHEPSSYRCRWREAFQASFAHPAMNRIPCLWTYRISDLSVDVTIGWRWKSVLIKGHKDLSLGQYCCVD